MPSIAPRVHIIGELRCSEDLLIEGRVDGNLHVPEGVLTIGPGAMVDADIRGRHVHVRGAVRGAISASERIELAASASVRGHLSANHVVIAEGARFDGHIDMNRRALAAKVARYTAERGNTEA